MDIIKYLSANMKLIIDWGLKTRDMDAFTMNKSFKL